MIKDILKLFFYFWIPSIIVIVINLVYGLSKGANPFSGVSFFSIISQNMLVIFIIASSGFVHKLLPYFIYYYNAIVFSIVLILTNNALSMFIQVSKYGIIEVMAFSVATYCGVKKKYQKLWIAVVLIVISGVIESMVAKGIL